MPSIHYPEYTHGTSSNSYRTAEDFYKFILQEFNKVTENKDFLVTAFLAYDASNPELVEMFSDSSRWSALNKDTGEDILLFYFDFKETLKKKYQEAVAPEVRKTRFPSSPKTEVIAPIDIPAEETPESITSYLLKVLGYDDYTSPKTPFVVFLRVENNMVVDNFCYHLKYDAIIDKAAYIELLNLIHRVTRQLNKVKRDENMDYKTVFDLVVQGADDSFIKNLKWILRLGKKGLDIKSSFT